MNDRLASLSKVYTENSEVYEVFSRCEDAPGKIASFLTSKIKGRVVLDFGCGTGRFISDFAPLAYKYFATDINDSQLIYAKQKALLFKNVQIYKTEPTIVPFPNQSIDVIFSSWVIGSLRELEIREAVLTELKRVLKPGGSIYLVENDKDGEYKAIVEPKNGHEKTILKNKWLSKYGFREAYKLQTFFSFPNIQIAKEVFLKIWDTETADRVLNTTIYHNLIIWEFSNN
jgi:ubiquinone/menaquinone biosynthesis C-methylase UbiE